MITWGEVTVVIDGVRWPVADFEYHEFKVVPSVPLFEMAPDGVVTITADGCEVTDAPRLEAHGELK